MDKSIVVVGVVGTLVIGLGFLAMKALQGSSNATPPLQVAPSGGPVTNNLVGGRGDGAGDIISGAGAAAGSILGGIAGIIGANARADALRNNANDRIAAAKSGDDTRGNDTRG